MSERRRWEIDGHETPHGTRYTGIHGPLLAKGEKVEVMPVSEHEAELERSLFTEDERAALLWWTRTTSEPPPLIGKRMRAAMDSAREKLKRLPLEQTDLNPAPTTPEPPPPASTTPEPELPAPARPPSQERT
jgi:hypothetical protein